MAEESKDYLSKAVDEAIFEDMSVENIAGISPQTQEELDEYRERVNERFSFLQPDGSPMDPRQMLEVISGAKNDAEKEFQKLQSKEEAGMKRDPLKWGKAVLLASRAKKALTDFAQGADLESIK